MRGLRVLVAVLVALFAWPLGSVAAHDYWLAPREFRIAPRGGLTVDLVVGDGFVAESSRPYESARTRSFLLHSRKHTIDPRPREGALPVLADHRSLGLRGQVLVVLERDWVDIALPDAKFGEYLAHEGLEEVAKLRDRAGHRQIERERYMRVVKTLVVVGRQRRRDALHSRVLGLPIEIVLLDDPAALEVGDRIHVHVLQRGKPLPGATLTAYVRDAKGRVTSRRLRADDRGITTFAVERLGAWMIRTVHLERCTDCGDADWQSQWASFSFAIDGGKRR